MQKAKIVVAVRKRPLFEKQKLKGYTDIISVSNGNRVIVSQMKQKVDLTKYMQESLFNFDHAFDQNCSNQQIYAHIISPLIESAFQGAKVSCFAYGQTGSGKTFTMNGVLSKNIPGLYTLGAYQIFEKLNQPEFSHLSAYLSFYEIYCTKLYDLLNKRTQLILREDAKSNINVVGLSQIPISNVQQFQNHLKVGSSQRVTSQNSANSQSSRSHAILQISLKNGKKSFGKVYFIDLAGNQRGADHANQKKQTQIDGQQINKSLLQLKQCIRGLDQGKNHVPFRGSKLTMCLKDSFIGFCRTVMIGNISPSSSSSQNTLNTLRYADRVKQLKNSQQLTNQQKKNRQMMLPRGNNNAIKINISNSDDQDDIAQKKRKALQEYGFKNQDNKLANNNANGKRQTGNNINFRPINQGTIKSTSISKNPVSGSIGNNTSFHGNNNNLNIKIPDNKKIQIKKFPQSPRQQTTTTNKFNKLGQQSNNDQGQGKGQLFKNQPMEIQKPHNNSLDMRKNPIGLGGGNNGNNNRIQFNNMNNMGNNSQIYSQQTNIDNNHEFVGHSSYMNNNNNIKNNNFMMNANNNNLNNNSNLNLNLNYNYKPLNTNNIFQQQQQRTNNMINNFTNNNFSQINQFSQQQRLNENLNFSNLNNINNNNRNRVLSNPKNNLVNGYQNQQQFNRNQNNFIGNNNNYEQQQLPEKWNDIVNYCQNTRDSSIQANLHQKLVSTLFQQQNDLINSHSNTLQYQIQKIKQQMQIIKVIQRDRSQISSKQYTKILYDSIDDKISQLQMLKEKLNNFMYKLDDMEEVQKKMEFRNNNRNTDDQQLLLDQEY